MGLPALGAPKHRRPVLARTRVVSANFLTLRLPLRSLMGKRLRHWRKNLNSNTYDASSSLRGLRELSLDSGSTRSISRKGCHRSSPTYRSDWPIPTSPLRRGQVFANGWTSRHKRVDRNSAREPPPAPGARVDASPKLNSPNTLLDRHSAAALIPLVNSRAFSLPYQSRPSVGP